MTREISMMVLGLELQVEYCFTKGQIGNLEQEPIPDEIEIQSISIETLDNVLDLIDGGEESITKIKDICLMDYYSIFSDSNDGG